MINPKINNQIIVVYNSCKTLGTARVVSGYLCGSCIAQHCCECYIQDVQSLIWYKENRSGILDLLGWNITREYWLCWKEYIPYQSVPYLEFLVGCNQTDCSFCSNLCTLGKSCHVWGEGSGEKWKAGFFLKLACLHFVASWLPSLFLHVQFQPSGKLRLLKALPTLFRWLFFFRLWCSAAVGTTCVLSIFPWLLQDPEMCIFLPTCHCSGENCAASNFVWHMEAWITYTSALLCIISKTTVC